ncbi:unnamed protein product [Adineta ricciae]|uniref:F-box domain-containing protein n=1 Tax=Adineta ricciae TaxID=249248 RepID=A0A815M3A4_ADIRI|nr:unnamed protein product [Adineta ricciae]
MERVKRSQSSDKVYHDHLKRTKCDGIAFVMNTKFCYRSSLGKSSVFEQLSNEILYEIFEYLDHYHAFQCFYDLNQRFRNLFYSKLPINTHLRSISKAEFHYYLTHTIIPDADRIQSLQISHPFVVELFLSLSCVMTKFTRLSKVDIHMISVDSIEQIIDCLSSMSFLSSLTLSSIAKVKNVNEICFRIFRLSSLKYCSLSLPTLRKSVSGSITEDPTSPIECLIIKSAVYIEQVSYFLSFLPKLRRLSIDHLTAMPSPLVILENSPPPICSIYESYDAYNWEQTIRNSMPYLETFDLEYVHHMPVSEREQDEYHESISKFYGSFWREHGWFFERQDYPQFEIGVFYSRSLHKKRYDLLFHESLRTSWPLSSKNPMHHVYFRSIEIMKESTSYFPNATHLTLTEYLNVNDLHEFLPLQRLIELTLTPLKFPFEQLLKLLQFAPNLHKITLSCTIFDQVEDNLIQSNELFQNVSKTNMITTVIVHRTIVRCKLPVITTLFSRTRYLSLHLHKEILRPIILHLLPASNSRIPYLSTLCLSSQQNNLMKSLQTIMKSTNILPEYEMKTIGRNLDL